MLAHADLESPPGSTFSYANSNYVLLAVVVQRMSGATFTSYMREAVFQPLGMHRTTLIDEVARSWEGASPHEWQWGRVRVSPSRFLGWYGSSRIKASAEDMGVYMAALLKPMATQAGGAWWDRLGPDYDLGWTVSKETEWLDDQLVLEHTGSLWGADTAVVMAPERGIGASVLVNMGTSRAGEIARAVLRSRDGTPLPEPHRTSRMGDSRHLGPDLPLVLRRNLRGACLVRTAPRAAGSFGRAHLERGHPSNHSRGDAGGSCRYIDPQHLLGFGTAPYRAPHDDTIGVASARGQRLGLAARGRRRRTAAQAEALKELRLSPERGAIPETS